MSWADGIRMGYEVILFDCGSTLLEFRPDERTRAWADIVERTPEEIDLAWRDARRGTPPLVGYETAEEYQDYRREICARAIDAVAFRGDRSAAATAMADAWVRVGWAPFADVSPALSQLRASGYRLGIVSNWTVTLELTLAQHGLAEHFDAIACSGLIGAMKPDPRIFRHALAILGVEAADALHVGDHYEADVLGARAAGLDAVLITRDDAAGSDVNATATTIHSLLELSKMLEGGRLDRRS